MWITEQKLEDSDEGQLSLFLQLSRQWWQVQNAGLQRIIDALDKTPEEYDMRINQKRTN